MSDSRSPSRASSNDDDENTQLMRQQNNQPQQQQQQQQQQGGGPVEGLGGIGDAVGEVSGNLNKNLGGLGGITGQQQQGGGSGGDQDVALQKRGSRKGADVNGNQLAPRIDDRTEEQKRLDDVGKKYKDDKSSLKIRIELDIDVEIHLSARVKGDITIGLL